jgi:hypothetical protein
MNDLKLYMLLLGCKPAGRNTEQHDLFFGMRASLSDVKMTSLIFGKKPMEKFILMDGEK